MSIVKVKYMKLKCLEILNTNNELMRSINFSDTFFVIGDIIAEDKKKTTNALGKSTLISIISFMLCGNNRNELSSLVGWMIRLSLFTNEGKVRRIERQIGSSHVIIDDNQFELSIAKEILSINRVGLDHIIHMDSRKEVINDIPSKESLYNAAMDILGLNDIGEVARVFAQKSNELSDLHKNKAKLTKELSEQEFIDQQLINNEILNIDQKLNSIENLHEEAIQKQQELLNNRRATLRKNLRNSIEKREELMLDIQTIDKFLIDSGDESNDILTFVKQVNEELSAILKSEMLDPLEFHKKLSMEHANRLINNRIKYESHLSMIDEEIRKYKSELPRLDSIIDDNDELRQIFKIQNQLNDEKNRLISSNRTIENLSVISKDEAKLKAEKMELYSNLLAYDLSAINDKFFKFTRNIVSEIYPESYESYFKINLIKSSKIIQSKYPILFDFKIKNDKSKGVRNARNFIVDLLMLKYSTKVDFMVWDSSAFNEIDTNQVMPLINTAIRIALESNKQIIIAINRFQLGEFYLRFLRDLDESNCIILSNDETLLGVDF